jgi:hypothetical protein
MTTHATINGIRTAAPEGAIAWKYADPTEPERWVYDEGDLREISSQDPGLLERVIAAAGE